MWSTSTPNSGNLAVRLRSNALLSRLPVKPMRIDSAYNGVSESSVILFDDGMCDGLKLEVGGST